MENPRRRWWMLVVIVCLVVSLFCVAYPVYVIRPFRTQHPFELMAALAVLRFRGSITILSALVATAAAIAYSGAQIRMGRRTAVAIGATLVAGTLAALARVNVYEQVMFHPLTHPGFVQANAGKIDPDDKLIVVKVNGVSRAYPIRTMGYHHVVNDEVGGTALVATY